MLTETLPDAAMKVREDSARQQLEIAEDVLPIVAAAVESM
jgi:hypothetical protein